MKQVSLVLWGLVTALIIVSCGQSFESKGNRAYNASQNAEGYEKRRLRKEAYMFYKKAVKDKPEKIGMKLRNRFIEVTAERAEMVLIEGSSEMDALPLFMADIDSLMNDEVDPDVRNKYASFMVTYADSAISKGKILDALGYFEKAKKWAENKEKYSSEINSIKDSIVNKNYEKAEALFESAGKEDQDDLIRAEYYAKLALFLDSSRSDARDLLQKLIKKNVQTYSAYLGVIEDMPDTVLFDKINKYDILLAVSDIKGNTYIVSMYNYSYNPLRLYPECFKLVDVNGEKYSALKSSKISKEFLDQEHEIELILKFPPVKSKVKKIIFESKNKEHYTEKRFM